MDMIASIRADDDDNNNNNTDVDDDGFACTHTNTDKGTCIYLAQRWPHTHTHGNGGMCKSQLSSDGWLRFPRSLWFRIRKMLFVPQLSDVFGSVTSGTNTVDGRTNQWIVTWRGTSVCPSNQRVWPLNCIKSNRNEDNEFWFSQTQTQTQTKSLSLTLKYLFCIPVGSSGNVPETRFRDSRLFFVQESFVQKTLLPTLIRHKFGTMI